MDVSDDDGVCINSYVVSQNRSFSVFFAYRCVLIYFAVIANTGFGTDNDAYLVYNLKVVFSVQPFEEFIRYVATSFGFFSIYRRNIQKLLFRKCKFRVFRFRSVVFSVS